MARTDRVKPVFVVVDRAGLADEIREITSRLGAPVEVRPFASVLDVLGDQGPTEAAAVVAAAASAGPFLGDLLRWTDREPSRIPAAVVGADTDEAALAVTLGRDHVRWIDTADKAGPLEQWVCLALEVWDLRRFLLQHETLATQLRDARMKLFYGETDQVDVVEGPPCGPPLPTSLEEIQSLKEAKAQFERGLIRAAVRESGSLKDASQALGISYTSLWRRMR